MKIEDIYGKVIPPLVVAGIIGIFSFAFMTFIEIKQGHYTLTTLVQNVSEMQRENNEYIKHNDARLYDIDKRLTKVETLEERRT